LAFEKSDDGNQAEELATWFSQFLKGQKEDMTVGVQEGEKPKRRSYSYEASQAWYSGDKERIERIIEDIHKAREQAAEDDYALLSDLMEAGEMLAIASSRQDEDEEDEER
jgi:hypothetical protein